MRQLSSLDAAFLAIESPRQHAHHSVLFVVDGELTLEAARALFAERLGLLDPFRWRLRTVPLGIDRPWWLEDPAPDLQFHVRETALPDGADDVGGADLVSRLGSIPLGRDRPLWLAHVIHGWPGGRTALLVVVHHSAIDGAGVMELVRALSDPLEAPVPPSPPADPVPSDGEMFVRGVRGVLRYWRELVRRLRAVVPHLRAAAAAQQGGAPRVSFNEPASSERRFVFGTLPLAAVRDAGRAHGATVNDVLLAISAGALRRWLLERGELPAGPLVVRVPVARRTQQLRFGNELGVLSAPFFTDVEDPLERLRRTHESVAERKALLDALPPTLERDALDLVPAPLARPLARLAARRPPLANVGMANVPGPREDRFVRGLPLESVHSFNTAAEGPCIVSLGLGDDLDMSVIVDRHQVPDAWKLIGWLREELDALTGEPHRARAPELDAGA
jgi:WS/DGAT/MGAT family acyltransferase